MRKKIKIFSFISTYKSSNEGRSRVALIPCFVLCEFWVTISARRELDLSLHISLRTSSYFLGTDDDNLPYSSSVNQWSFHCKLHHPEL
jgi:hypothetical protein